MSWRVILLLWGLTLATVVGTAAQDTATEQAERVLRVVFHREPMPGARVRLYSVVAPGRDLQAELLTDATGQVTVPGSLATRWLVYVIETAEGIVATDLLVPGQSQEEDLWLWGRVRVRTVRADGTPVSATVRALVGDCVLEEVRTDADGAAVLSATGRLRVVARSDDGEVGRAAFLRLHVHAKSGREPARPPAPIRRAATIVVRPDLTGVLVGRVVDAEGHGVARAAAHVRWGDADANVVETLTDDLGWFRVEDLPTVRAQVEVYREHEGEPLLLGALDDVAVRAGAETTIQVPLTAPR